MTIQRSRDDWAYIRVIETERDRLRIDNAGLRTALQRESIGRADAERWLAIVVVALCTLSVLVIVVALELNDTPRNHHSDPNTDHSAPAGQLR
jgi:hypothetical protein